MCSIGEAEGRIRTRTLAGLPTTRLYFLGCAAMVVCSQSPAPRDSSNPHYGVSADQAHVRDDPWAFLTQFKPVRTTLSRVKVQETNVQKQKRTANTMGEYYKTVQKKTTTQCVNASFTQCGNASHILLVSAMNKT
jgi:hypothetical protein